MPRHVVSLVALGCDRSRRLIADTAGIQTGVREWRAVAERQTARLRTSKDGVRVRLAIPIFVCP